jgi:hypothetical protein
VLIVNPSNSSFSIVIPAKAGIHRATARAAEKWVPAFAGTTIEGASRIERQ